MFYLGFLVERAQVEHVRETISKALEAVEIRAQNQCRSRLSRGREQITIGKLTAELMDLKRQAIPRKESRSCEIKIESGFD